MSGDFDMGVLQSLESLKSTIKQQSLGDCGTVALLADDQVCGMGWGLCVFPPPTSPLMYSFFCACFLSSCLCFSVPFFHSFCRVFWA